MYTINKAVNSPMICRQNIFGHKVLCYAVLHERKFVFVGLSEEELMAELETLKSADVDPHSGKLFAYSYHSEGDKLEVVKEFYDKFEEQLPITPAKERIVQAFFSAFMQENALNPLVFPSLRFVFSSSVDFLHPGYITH